MYGIVINSITIGIILPTAGRTYDIIQYPCRAIVSLDSRLHVQNTSQHIAQVSIKTLDILVGIRDCLRVLVRVRIYEACAELDELSVHSVVYTCCITTEVRTCTLDGTFLVVEVKSYIISIVCTTTAEVYIVVLTDTSLESLLKPVGVCIVLEVIVTIGTKTVATGKRCARVGCCSTEIVAVLVGIHQIVLVV